MTHIDEFLKNRPADMMVSDLLIRVGERVRRAREEQGLPRRVLSEMSGVSPRYLALLESGDGNISIGLLMRVALALNKQIDWLVSEDDPKARKPSRANRVCLIGLRGAGKSTLGKLVGQERSVPFVELNRVIEDLGGMPVSEIMALYGQEGYRKLEAEALEKVSVENERVILAVAGGIVAEPATYAALLTRFHTIWIKASPVDHMSRVRAQGDLRPMEGTADAMAQLRAILLNREALYERALAQLDTSERTVDSSLKQLLDILKSRNYLDG
jgi:XRE family aerobic/anaerobic benzoate catabolism transcriptional regulator